MLALTQSSTSLNNLMSGLIGMLVLTTLAACGGGGYGGGSNTGCGGGAYGGMGSCSSSSSSSSSAALTINFSASQIFPAPTTTATATASLVINATTGVVSGAINVSGVTATSVTINDAFAGDDTGAPIITLTPGSSASVWNVPASTTLSAGQLSDFNAGKLYVLISSATNPNGELRAQIIPANIKVAFTTLAGDRELPTVTTSATGIAAITVNTQSNSAAVHVNTSGANSATASELHASFENGSDTLVSALTSPAAGHWQDESIALSAGELANFNSSRWYVNVITPTHTTGEIRAQVAVNPPTLTALQASALNVCGTCHNGVGAALPGVQNLTTAAQIHTNVVNVASIEQGTLKRILPYRPDDSWLIRKIEGDPSIAPTAQMPLNGPYLSQAQIDQVRAWAAAGALNN